MSGNMLYLVRLDAMRKSGHGAESKIAGYILLYPERVQNMTIQELAEQTDTSYATVCRFFKKLGESGFLEFKKLFREELGRRKLRDVTLEFNIEHESQTSFEEICGRICDYSASIISSFPRILKRERFERLVHILKKAEQIYFIGLGTSAVTAQYAYTKFFRLKPTCSFDSDIILAKMKAVQMKSTDVLFAISSSGRTKSILEIARVAKDSGATIISICDFANSPLSNLSDYFICTTVRESNKYIDTDFPLIQGQITLIDILYAYMYNSSPEYSGQKFKRTKEAVFPDKLMH